MLRSWRLFLGAAGILLFFGGPLHPRADPALPFNVSTAAMLADPHWPISHGLMLAGDVCVLLALIGLRRRTDIPISLRRALQLAVIGASLAVVEMAFHLAAVVDRAALVAGAATPVLTIHLSLAVVAFPVFGLSMSAVAFLGARQRAIGGATIAGLGILGGLMDAVSAPIVVLTRDQHYSWLFIGVLPLAIWMCLAAIWPRPRMSDRPAT